MKFSLKKKLLGLLVGASTLTLAWFVTPTDYPSLVNSAMLGVLEVQATGTSASALGSGFFVDDSGLILTNAHVVLAVAEPKVLIRSKENSKWFECTTVAVDELADVALVRIDGWRDFRKNVPYKVLPIGSSHKLRPGDDVWAIGMPVGLSWTLTKGVLSANERKQSALSPVYNMQTDLHLTHGNSGGPLFNADGEVVGINNMIYGLKEGGEISFAIPTEIIKKIVRDFQKGDKEITWPLLGIGYKESPDGVGMSVLSVAPNSVLAGKVAVGDTILQITTKYSPPTNLINTEDLPDRSFVLDVGDRVEFKVVNENGNVKTVNAILTNGKTSAEFEQDATLVDPDHDNRRSE